MPNGSPGDGPLTDILIHKRDVYSPLASALIRQIAGLADEKTLRDLDSLLGHKYHQFKSPNIVELEQYLGELRDKLLREARDRGFELPGT